METKHIIIIILAGFLIGGTWGYFWGKSNSRTITEKVRVTSHDTVYVSDDTCNMVLESMMDTLDKHYRELIDARVLINNLKHKYTKHEQSIKIDSLNYPGLYSKLKEYESSRNH